MKTLLLTLLFALVLPACSDSDAVVEVNPARDPSLFAYSDPDHDGNAVYLFNGDRQLDYCDTLSKATEVKFFVAERRNGALTTNGCWTAVPDPDTGDALIYAKWMTEESGTLYQTEGFHAGLGAIE